MSKGSTDWRKRHLSFYYEGTTDELPEIKLNPEETALLVIDLQNAYLPEKQNSSDKEWQRWAPFRSRLSSTVLPQTNKLLKTFRAQNAEVIYVRIACHFPDGRDRSFSHARPGFNNLLLPKNEKVSQILPAVSPLDSEVVLTKTTDSALTGTNLRLLLANLQIKNVVACGIFTDQCVSCTVRSLADESFNVIVVEDACAAATDELHNQELAILNNIYCQVLNTSETLSSLTK